MCCQDFDADNACEASHMGAESLHHGEDSQASKMKRKSEILSVASPCCGKKLLQLITEGAPKILHLGKDGK